MMDQSAHDTVASDRQEDIAAKRARGTRRARALWRLGSRYVRKPAVGAAVAGTAVLAVGALCGATEAAIAGVAAWAVFRTLRRRSATSPSTNEKATSRPSETNPAAAE